MVPARRLQDAAEGAAPANRETEAPGSPICKRCNSKTSVGEGFKRTAVFHPPISFRDFSTHVAINSKPEI